MKRILVASLFAATASGSLGRAHAALPGLIEDPDRGSGRAPVDPGPGPPATPEPKRGGGDAQPAPVPSPEPGTSTMSADAEEGPPPRHRISVMPRFAYRLGDAGQSVTPAPGFGVGGTIEISYLRLGPGTGLGSTATGSFARPQAGPYAVWEAALGIDFAHDRFAISEQGSVTVDGMLETFASTRVLSETSFVLVHTVAARVGRVRPYLTLGGGLGIGYFDSAASELRPGTARDAHVLGRVSLGFDVTFAHSWNAAIRADYTAVRGASPLVTDAGRSLTIFGDLFDLGAGIAYRF
jgi:hypothetical protein